MTVLAMMATGLAAIIVCAFLMLLALERRRFDEQLSLRDGERHDGRDAGPAARLRPARRAGHSRTDPLVSCPL